MTNEARHLFLILNRQQQAAFSCIRLSSIIYIKVSSLPLYKLWANNNKNRGDEGTGKETRATVRTFVDEPAQSSAAFPLALSLALSPATSNTSLFSSHSLSFVMIQNKSVLTWRVGIRESHRSFFPS